MHELENVQYMYSDNHKRYTDVICCMACKGCIARCIVTVDMYITQPTASLLTHMAAFRRYIEFHNRFKLLIIMDVRINWPFWRGSLVRHLDEWNIDLLTPQWPIGASNEYHYRQNLLLGQILPVMIFIARKFCALCIGNSLYHHITHVFKKLRSFIEQLRHCTTYIKLIDKKNKLFCKFFCCKFALRRINDIHCVKNSGPREGPYFSVYALVNNLGAAIK